MGLDRNTPPAATIIPISIRRTQVFGFNYLILSPFSVKYLTAPG
jgi:hypothetical protein